MRNKDRSTGCLKQSGGTNDIGHDTLSQPNVVVPTVPNDGRILTATNRTSLPPNATTSPRSDTSIGSSNDPGKYPSPSSSLRAVKGAADIDTESNATGSSFCSAVSNDGGTHTATMTPTSTCSDASLRRNDARFRLPTYGKETFITNVATIPMQRSGASQPNGTETSPALLALNNDGRNDDAFGIDTLPQIDAETLTVPNNGGILTVTNPFSLPPRRTTTTPRADTPSPEVSDHEQHPSTSVPHPLQTVQSCVDTGTTRTAELVEGASHGSADNDDANDEACCSCGSFLKFVAKLWANLRGHTGVRKPVASKQRGPIQDDHTNHQK